MGWREVMYGRSVEADEVERSGAEARVPGWHTDPEQPDRKRYWDGERWGEEPWNEPAPRPKPTGKANRLGVTALILACLGPFLVGGILATVFGMVAMDEIEESEGKERGKGIAQWAIGLGFLNIAVSCAAIVLVVKALTS